MRTCQLLALVLFVAATVVSVVFKSWPIALVAAGLAFEVAPAALQLS